MKPSIAIWCPTILVSLRLKTCRIGIRRFPVDLKKVRPKDEDYWHRYRTTPKAFISLETGIKLWQSRHGKYTSLRLRSSDGSDPGSRLESFKENLRAALSPAEMGLSIEPVRTEGLAASRGATDFGEYFVYFSFFLVVGALLLASLFFKLGIEQRLREIGTLRAVGFAARDVRWLFLREGVALATAGSLLGVIGAVGYGELMMYGLRTWWVGAVGTTMLSLHVSALSLSLGCVGGIAAALLCIVWTLRGVSRASPRSLLSGSLDAVRTKPAHRRISLSGSSRDSIRRRRGLSVGRRGVGMDRRDRRVLWRGNDVADGLVVFWICLAR